MKKISYYFLITCIIITTLSLVGCNSDESTSTSAVTKTSATSNTTSKVNSTTSTTTSSSQIAESNWWDEFGEPQYGGEIVFADSSIQPVWDPYVRPGGMYQYYLDSLWVYDWTLDRNTFAYSTPFVPSDYFVGSLVEKWEMTDDKTITIHIREGVKWQDKEPLNGREFTAYDVQFHYDRMLGTGNGYTEPNSVYKGRTGNLLNVTATDNYTATITFSNASAWNIYTLFEQSSLNYIEAPELVQDGTNVTDWSVTVGTGPWMVSDYLADSSITFSKNTNYWGYDSRYDNKQIPYADTFKILCIPEATTRVAALRTGQIDLLQNLSLLQESALLKSNPELSAAKLPAAGTTLEFRLDTTPFDDIRVRQALQMSIDRETIAQSHYDNTLDYPYAGVVNPAIGDYSYGYESWSDELKGEYSYNPEQAKVLLAEAGYPDGFTTNVVIGADQDTELAEIIKSYLAEIDVDMEIQSMDAVSYISYTRAFKHDQMAVNASTGVVVSPDQALGMYVSTNSSNIARVNDATYDAIYQNFKDASTIADAKKYLTELDQYAIEQHFGLRVVPINEYNVWQTSLKGYSGENMKRSSVWLTAYLWKSDSE